MVNSDYIDPVAEDDINPNRFTGTDLRSANLSRVDFTAPDFRRHWLSILEE